MCAKPRTAAASNNRDHESQSLLWLLAHATHIYFCSSCTSHSWWITRSTQNHRRSYNNILSFSQRTTPIACSLCEGWTRHDLHILVTTPFSCDRKSRVACAHRDATCDVITSDLMFSEVFLMFDAYAMNLMLKTMFILYAKVFLLFIIFQRSFASLLTVS